MTSDCDSCGMQSHDLAVFGTLQICATCAQTELEKVSSALQAAYSDLVAYQKDAIYWMDLARQLRDHLQSVADDAPSAWSNWATHILTEMDKAKDAK